MKTRRASIEIKFQLLFAFGLVAMSLALMSFSSLDNSDAVCGEEKPLRNPTQPAKFCSGETDMFQFLSRELKYPEIPRVNGESGLVQVQFVVTKDGKVRDAKVLRPVNPWLDAEALRVAKLLDCFAPAMDEGKAVDAYFVLPIRFSLAR
jgi:protein TonB